MDTDLLNWDFNFSLTNIFLIFQIGNNGGVDGTRTREKEKLSEVLKQNNPLQIKEEADKLGNLTADFANYVMEVSIKNHSKNI